MPSLRYVVLRHEGIADPHFDLMFETAPGSALKTWRSPTWPITEATPLVELGDHRHAYLEYEGPISNNRGNVRRVCGGSFDIASTDETNWRIVQDDSPSEFFLSNASGSWVATPAPTQRKSGETRTSTMDNEWRKHPSLASRFHPDHPDDLQVIVHDGGPRITRNRPELVWVRVIGCEGDIFSGHILNAPKQLTGIAQDQEIRFLVADGSKYPFLVTDKYLAERNCWTIVPCNKCGFPELFDAPSDLLRAIFPNLPEGSALHSFTSFCPLCGGVQVLNNQSSGSE